jgi:hypothetical protein
MSDERRNAVTPQAKLYDRDTERQLVGAALLDPRLFADSIDPADFYLDDLRTVWETGRDLSRQGITPDQVTLADALERRGADIRRSFIASLAAENLSTGYAETWAATVRDYARRRRVFALLQDGLIGAQNGANLDATIDGVLAGLERLLDADARRRRDQAQAASLTKSHWSAAELLDTLFDGPLEAVKDLLPVGLTLLGGPAMSGKSWLALQFAIAVATGGSILGRQTEAGRVLYLAPDDEPRRVSARAAKQGMPRAAEIDFATEWRCAAHDPPLDLERVLGEGGYWLVVVDTLSGALGTGALPVAASRIRRAALDAGAAVLAVDRPVIQQEILDRVSCDAILTLERAEDGKRGLLRVSGRDVEPHELPLDWEPVTCIWRLASDPAAGAPSSDGASSSRRRGRKV